MKKILYIISKEQDPDFNELLSSPQSSDYSVSAIFVQEGTEFTHSWPFPCFVLGDHNAQNTNKEKTYSKIQYFDMLQMIFDADMVISL
ncbi:hypothetical protein [Candidatus Nitronereus thalassa]|uniref:DsrE/DsrF-like family protein n=1 Tax=Candidatus Nitronereus thalassa TaxID=3020898 RepID=A0ABU3K954_9BACT|nr:hypothetical protein [Candidatus Nitronereus thalassa]MDT7042894.1 hypothetical protein [Candidatus Nitronereus thalassa]